MGTKTATHSAKPESSSIIAQAQNSVFQREADKQPENPLQAPIWRPAISSAASSPPPPVTGAGHNFAHIPVLSPHHQQRLQTKLTIGNPNDKYEQEADRVADMVMRMPEPNINVRSTPTTATGSGLIQRTCASCSSEYESATDEQRPIESSNLCPKCRTDEKILQSPSLIAPSYPSLQRQEMPDEEEKKDETNSAKRQTNQIIQTRLMDNSSPPSIQRQKQLGDEKEDEETKSIQMKGQSGTATRLPPGIIPGIKSLQGSGQPLSPAVRGFMEPRFGQDFGQVRVHSGTNATRLAKQINARAFTIGRDIAFATGQYQPNSTSGKRLLAHELTHTVQQTGKTSVQPVDQPAMIAAPRISRQTRVNHIARFPSPPDAHIFRPGLSPIGPIYKNTYDGTASTTIKPGWEMYSWERRWQLYDADDNLLDEQFYTIPAPTYTIKKEFVSSGKAGGEQKPWSVWIKVTKTLVPFGGDNPDNFPYSYVKFPVYNTELDRKAAKQEEEEKGGGDFGIAVPKGASPTRPANTKVSPDIALKILENYASGKPPFKPELGKGGASWFVTEGNPYTGVSPDKNINIDVELVKDAQPIVFDEAKLNEIYAEQLRDTAVEAEIQYRKYKGLDSTSPLNSKMRKGLARFRERFAESRMWDRVGEMVRSSKTKVGEVILKEGGKFSKTPGKFSVVADASKIQIKGGVDALVTTLNQAGAGAEPVLIEAAKKLATKQKWAGRVRGVFRYGGRILLVFAIAADAYKIYYAEDRLKATITTAGGWAGATAAGAAFAAWFTPADTAGPLAWAAHGVGTLVAGGIGYWIGSETTRFIYELVPVD